MNDRELQKVVEAGRAFNAVNVRYTDVAVHKLQPAMVRYGELVVENVIAGQTVQRAQSIFYDGMRSRTSKEVKAALSTQLDTALGEHLRLHLELQLALHEYTSLLAEHSTVSDELDTAFQALYSLQEEHQYIAKEGVGYGGHPDPYRFLVHPLYMEAFDGGLYDKATETWSDSLVGEMPEWAVIVIDP